MLRRGVRCALGALALGACSPKTAAVVTTAPAPAAATATAAAPAPAPAGPAFQIPVEYYTLPNGLRVTNSLLGGSFGSRITRNIREDKGYTYSPYSSVGTHYHTGDWSESADVTTKDTYNSLHEIVNEIERLQKTPPSADELKGIQNYESGMFVLRNSNPGGIISQLNNLDLQGLPDSFLTEQVKNINAVTPAQVSATARQYIRPEAMTIVVVGDQKVVAPQIKKFQDSLKKPL
ncbi:hypothetical protein AXW84_19120 [Hymenobacter sp. PAMC 26628]|nr:hypothetical protein AXW84_19120 [Hymenobacter sp. PAMC 26628]